MKRERGVIDYDLYERTALSVIQSWLFTYSPCPRILSETAVRVARRLIISHHGRSERIAAAASFSNARLSRRISFVARNRSCCASVVSPPCDDRRFARD